MQRTKEIEVQGVKYKVTQFVATKSVTIFEKVLKLIGSPVGMLANSLEEEVTGDLVSKAIGAMTENLDPVRDIPLFKDILSTSQIVEEDGTHREINFDIDFAGRIGHLFRVLYAILEFQYSDFLAVVADAKSMVSAAPKKKAGIKAK